MRKLGLIGGMSWVSTRTYYERINRMVQQSAGLKSSAPLLIENLDFSQLYGMIEEDEWERATVTLSESAKRLQDAGAGAILIAANSMYRVYDSVQAAISVPIIHIADCMGRQMAANGVETAALLGTRNVMTESFYRRRLVAHGVDLLPPDMDNVEVLDRIIYDELMIGKATRDSQRVLKSMITNLERAGAQAVVLACTELEMIVTIDANVLPIYDSARIHARAGAEWILGSD